MPVKGAIRDLIDRPPQNVTTLDVLRTLAILLVFTDHFADTFGSNALVWRLPMVYFGWTGVDLFFVLSGLLIGMQLWKELNRTGGIQIPVFLARRGLRIWPLYYGFAALILLEGLFFHRDLNGFWADLTFLSNYFHNQIGGGWSLSTEEQFYILIPISLLVISRFAPLRRMWIFPVVVLMCLPIVRALTIHALGVDEAKRRMYLPIHTHSDGLAAGVLLAWAAVFHPGFLKSDLARKIVAPASVLAAALLYFLNHNIFNYSSLALLYGAMTLYGLGMKRPTGALNWVGFYILSRLSYGIYLNHFGLLPRVLALIKPLLGAGAAGWVSAYIITLAACTLFAFVTFAFIERPFLLLRDKWLRSRSTAKADAVVKSSYA